MCGLGGIVARRGGLGIERLECMIRALNHRGPDDRGLFCEDRVGFAHTRLSILDLSPSGHQPMLLGHEFVLVYNGEIFNHLELRRELPGPWMGSSDTETLLHALAKWGSKAVLRLNGQFAFALFDRLRNRVLLGRDQFGIKPLYYVQQGDELIFGSEIGALIAAGYKPLVDPVALRHAIDMAWVGGKPTPFAAVRRILPGTVIEIDVDDLSTSEWEYFHPADLVSPERLRELAAGSPASNALLVEDSLRSAVRKQLLSDVPVGTLLSGGVDSSVLTALAAESNPGLHAFNASIVDGTGLDEGPYAVEVAQHLGVNLHTIKMDRNAWAETVVSAVRHYEYPLTHEASVPLSRIANLAREKGVKVLLSGEGADEIFGGYPWLHIPDWRLWYNRGPLSKRLKTEARIILTRLGVLPFEGSREPRLGPLDETNTWEARNLARCLAAYRRHGRARRQLEGKLLDEIHVYLQQILCRADKNIMQSSIESRVPFLDVDFVALALNYPLEQKVEPRRKEPLRQLADKLLPPIVSARRKVGFQADVSGYFGAADSKFLDDGYLRQIFEAPKDAWNERISGAKYREAILLWTAEIWCRLFLAGCSVASVEAELWSG